jgi:antitoxin (DNA-binding transcriptional repressor) of toxin-antitoxin stability system
MLYTWPVSMVKFTLETGVMNVPINAKRLRATLSEVVERVREGTRFTVIYRSRPACQIVPVDDKGGAPIVLAEDTLFVPKRWARQMTDGRPSITTRSCTHDERRVRRYRRLDGLCGPERSCSRGLHGRP